LSLDVHPDRLPLHKGKGLGRQRLEHLSLLKIPFEQISFYLGDALTTTCMPKLAKICVIEPQGSYEMLRMKQEAISLIL
jgi:hypothetical protein